MADLDSIRITLDLERFGELVAHVAGAFAEIRGIDPPDFEGQEMRELAISSYRHVEYMADRSQFKRSVEFDLETLERNPFPQV
jgi:hypothetical protein